MLVFAPNHQVFEDWRRQHGYGLSEANYANGAQQILGLRFTGRPLVFLDGYDAHAEWPDMSRILLRYELKF